MPEEEKKKRREHSQADKEMLHERDYEPQSRSDSGSTRYRDSWDAA